MKFTTFAYVCITREKKFSIFAAKMVTFSACNTNIYKIWKLPTAIFSMVVNYGKFYIIIK